MESFATAVDQDEEFGQVVGIRTENHNGMANPMQSQSMQPSPYGGGGGMLGSGSMWGQQQQQQAEYAQPWGIPGGVNDNNGRIETASDVFRKEREANGGAVEGGDSDAHVDDER